jgi:hypothetical protein
MELVHNFEIISYLDAQERGIEYAPFHEPKEDWPFIWGWQLGADGRDANGINDRETKIYLQPVGNNIFVVDTLLHTWSFAADGEMEAEINAYLENLTINH